ncbi:MAG TPA: HAMP domain-containing sensor histidine kinase [Isosphaeraceae bacterium]|jgi:signal transduction histidine kinase|nr:HAMP domain-containing sensor histidine kinase [Isosphaeraceae bacterium]
MESLWNVLAWFAGGRSQHGHGAFNYMDLLHCMNRDWGWIAATVALDLTVATGYVLIALHWWTNQRRLANGPAKTALGDMRNIFVFCGICGYLFIPIKMFWPAWRLYDGFLVVLAFYTWRYAWGARGLKVIYNSLEQTERLAVDLEQSRAESRRKTHFLNAISHDLRTPLNGLVLQVELAEILASEGDERELRASLAEIRAGALATAELLDSFLEIGRLDGSEERNRSTRFDLGELLREAVERSRAFADAKALGLSATAPPGLVVVADRIKLLRILLNLIHNGLKFTETGGVRVVAERAGPGAVVHVEDTGVGIAPEHRELLFDEFFQVRNDERDRRKGFGLGLSIARRLAQQIGAEITVESQPGRGSRFTVAIADVEAAADDGADSPVVEPGQNGHLGRPRNVVA